ncbi:MAG: type II toxin-antitoxin system VapC family toxin [Lewinellaceae bacterium]|nr:type II toxin-antitoxin system VapC family toxin [Lewinellaceae bacterium]
MGLACKSENPAYDGFYLALAKQLDATLVTADKRLIKVAKNWKYGYCTDGSAS